MTNDRERALKAMEDAVKSLKRNIKESARLIRTAKERIERHNPPSPDPGDKDR